MSFYSLYFPPQYIGRAIWRQLSDTRTDSDASFRVGGDFHVHGGGRRHDNDTTERDQESDLQKSHVQPFVVSAGNPQKLLLCQIHRRAHKNAGGLDKGNEQIKRGLLNDTV